MYEHIIYAELAKSLIQIIEDAVGDSIQEDIANNHLRYFNSTPSRIWDHIYSSLEVKLETLNCSVISSNSGPWHFALIYDRTTDNIITVMREKRFSTLKKQQCKRNKPHYVDALAAALNDDLKPQFEQMSLLGGLSIDKEAIQIRVNQLLSELGGESEFVQNHVLVLFEANDFRLISARAIMVTPNLDIAVNGEVDLSKYISSRESIIMGKTDGRARPKTEEKGNRAQEPA